MTNENLGKFTQLSFALTIGPVINGFVFARLWEWFAVPVFHVQMLSIAQSIGIVLLISYTHPGRRKIDKEVNFWEKLNSDLSNSMITAIVALLLGWVVKFFL